MIEADLDEIYYYRFDRPEGYALQRIYTGPIRHSTLPVARSTSRSSLVKTTSRSSRKGTILCPARSATPRIT